MKNLILAILSVLFLVTGAFAGEKDKVKAGFVYVGPVGDHGWTYRHDIGRQDVEKHFGDKVETVYVENVPEGADAERVMTQMALQGVDIIFATSFGYMEPVMNVAKKFPNIKFEHATGYKTSPNAANYGLKLYQARHIQGLIAGMMTKTNKICYVASYPIPEVIREINTYYLGAKKMNPDVELKITWVFTWYNPGKERDAAKVMIDQGCDMVAQHTDSPAPLIAAQEAGVHGFGQASDQIKFAPKAQLTATIDNWSPYYIAKIQALLDGTWETGAYFGDISECDATGCAVGMAPFTNLPQDVIDQVTEVRSQIAAGTYHAFTGPITDNEGKLQLADGIIADRAHIDSMMYYVKGIDAEIPN